MRTNKLCAAKLALHDLPRAGNHRETVPAFSFARSMCIFNNSNEATVLRSTREPLCCNELLFIKYFIDRNGNGTIMTTFHATMSHWTWEGNPHACLLLGIVEICICWVQQSDICVNRERAVIGAVGANSRLFSMQRLLRHPWTLDEWSMVAYHW